MKVDFFPYGIAQQNLTGSGTPESCLYTGKERDETGLDYFGARYYDSSLGRFLSVDPAGPDPMNPMSWNRYAYCLNNPYKYVDPDGRWGKNVHYDETLRRAQALFTKDDAKVIANACNGTDSIWGGISYMPLIGKQGFHFNTGNGNWNSPDDTRKANAEKQLQKAIGMAFNGFYNDALKELGIGLHALQDIFAHNEEFQEDNGIFFYHDQLLLNLKPNLADDIKTQPKRLDDTKEETDRYFDRFNKAIASRGSLG